jgi:conserved oligomeric Golgi complex subunit 6
MVAELEAQIQSLKSSLETAQSDIQAKHVAIDLLEQMRSASEAQVAEVKATWEKLQSEDRSASLAVREEVMFPRSESGPCIYYFYSL